MLLNGRLVRTGLIVGLSCKGTGIWSYIAEAPLLWATGTNGFPGSHLSVQDDGNIVIYGPSGWARWSRYSGKRQPGCYGDYCSGKDPGATGCSDDAVTVAWINLSGARLDLRWSPICKTNWARWQQYPIGLKSDIPTALAAVQDTGYTQSIAYSINGPGVGTTWTPMIYSPVHLVRAVATVQCGSDSILGSIVDCAMNGKVETSWG